MLTLMVRLLLSVSTLLLLLTNGTCSCRFQFSCRLCKLLGQLLQFLRKLCLHLGGGGKWFQKAELLCKLAACFVDVFSSLACNLLLSRQVPIELGEFGLLCMLSVDCCNVSFQFAECLFDGQELVSYNGLLSHSIVEFQLDRHLTICKGCINLNLLQLWLNRLLIVGLCICLHVCLYFGNSARLVHLKSFKTLLQQVVEARLPILRSLIGKWIAPDGLDMLPPQCILFLLQEDQIGSSILVQQLHALIHL
mmetsp:Transcript_120058/g.239050  ORF Transcript_120058/g.239050 Transcript_120058/m.239050 type:complete len:250 (+) Transcript_120058:181-930(+)